MKTLLLKDVTAYLPYGLKTKDKEGLLKTVMVGMGLSYFMSAYCKPYLRPMSDLTKEIMHKGDTFVPILKLVNILYPSIKEWAVESKCVWGRHNGEYIRVAIDQCDCASYEIFDLLSEWMFDYRGLIDKGLAIDVNTLTENPYEL